METSQLIHLAASCYRCPTRRGVRLDVNLRRWDPASRGLRRLRHLDSVGRDQAFAWLEKAYQERSRPMAYLRAEPALDPLRSDPRFQDLLRRMNFPE